MTKLVRLRCLVCIALAAIASIVPHARAAIELDAGENLQWANPLSTTDPPYTLVAWIKVADASSGCSAFSINRGNQNDSYAVGLSPLTSNRATARAWGNGGNLLAAHAESIDVDAQDDAWHHIAATFQAGDAYRAAFLDGDNKGTDTASGSVYATAYLTIGDLNFAPDFDGRIAEVAGWEIELSDAEIAQLAAGTPPTEIQPEHLLFYCSGAASTTAEIGGAPDSTTGTPTVVGDHPPMQSGVSVPLHIQLYEGDR